MKLGPRLPAVTLASAQMGRSDILQLSSCSLPCSPFSHILGLTLCQGCLSILVGKFFFFNFCRIIFCHVSELKQLAEESVVSGIHYRQCVTRCGA